MREQLLEISGVGDATADDIMQIVEANTDENEQGGPWLEKAYSALEDDDEQAALTYLKRSRQ